MLRQSCAGLFSVENSGSPPQGVVGSVVVPPPCTTKGNNGSQHVHYFHERMLRTVAYVVGCSLFCRCSAALLPIVRGGARMTSLTARAPCRLGGVMHGEDERNGQEVVGKMWDCCGIRS